MKLTTTEKFILADTLGDVINDARKSGVNRPELEEILEKISQPELFSVFITVEGNDWNYLVRARNQVKAKAAALKYTGMEIIAKKAESWLLEDIAPENIPKKNGDVYLFDSGT